ncbi:hypothetical protein [Paraburkholderia youngii]|uniref:hypothetical protein n=1 Tax=Paraburkholderia youngii TaxID=2782701 RepID=UPI003D231FE4
MNHARTILGDTRQRFFASIQRYALLTIEQLVDVARDQQRFSPRSRAAALRHIVARAPIEVTLGRPFAARRRLVRKHFGV